MPSLTGEIIKTSLPRVQNASGIRPGGNESVKMRVPKPGDVLYIPPNMLMERVFIHTVRIPLRPKTRYTGRGQARAAATKAHPSAIVRGIVFEV